MGIVLRDMKFDTLLQLFYVKLVDKYDINPKSYMHRNSLVGNCWFLAAVAVLTSQTELFDYVVPEQSFSKEYAGKARISF